MKIPLSYSDWTRTLKQLYHLLRQQMETLSSQVWIEKELQTISVRKGLRLTLNQQMSHLKQLLRQMQHQLKSDDLMKFVQVGEHHLQKGAVKIKLLFKKFTWKKFYNNSFYLINTNPWGYSGILVSLAAGLKNVLHYFQNSNSKHFYSISNHNGLYVAIIAE